MPINTLKHKVTINESDLVSQNKHEESNRVESKKKKEQTNKTKQTHRYREQIGGHPRKRGLGRGQIGEGD